MLRGIFRPIVFIFVKLKDLCLWITEPSMERDKEKPRGLSRREKRELRRLEYLKKHHLISGTEEDTVKMQCMRPSEPAKDKGHSTAVTGYTQLPKVPARTEETPEPKKAKEGRPEKVNIRESARPSEATKPAAPDHSEDPAAAGGALIKYPVSDSDEDRNGLTGSIAAEVPEASARPQPAAVQVSDISRPRSTFAAGETKKDPGKKMACEALMRPEEALASDITRRRMTFILQNITKTYEAKGGGEIVAVDDACIVIPPCKVTGIVGPSGSGKSTLMKILGGITEPTSGNVHFQGDDMYVRGEAWLAEYRKTRVAWVFQEMNLFSHLRAWMDITSPLVINGKRWKDLREIADQALQAVGLDPNKCRDKFPWQFSGGERQRIAIARAYVKNANVLLADEPTGNLDTDLAIVIFELLRKYAEDNQANVFLITHNEGLANECDNVFRFNRSSQIAPDRIGSS